MNGKIGSRVYMDYRFVFKFNQHERMLGCFILYWTG